MGFKERISDINREIAKAEVIVNQNKGYVNNARDMLLQVLKINDPELLALVRSIDEDILSADNINKLNAMSHKEIIAFRKRLTDLTDKLLTIVEEQYK